MGTFVRAHCMDDRLSTYCPGTIEQRHSSESVWDRDMCVRSFKYFWQTSDQLECTFEITWHGAETELPKKLGIVKRILFRMLFAANLMQMNLSGGISTSQPAISVGGSTESSDFVSICHNYKLSSAQNLMHVWASWHPALDRVIRVISTQH